MTIRDIAVAIGFDVDESGIEELDTKIKKVFDDISKGVDKSSESVKSKVKETASAAGKSAEESAKTSGAKVKSTINDISSYAKKLLGKIAVVFSVTKMVSFAKDCIDMASSVEEMENKFDVVFDGINDEVDAWAEEFANAVGRNKNTIKGYLADQQNLLVGFGMTREEGAELSEQMTSLALDIASFANMDEDTAVNAMTKAIMGQSESAKTLGAVLNDTTRAETMLAMGLEGSYSDLDTLTQMQVNYQTILRQSADAVGDCERSIDSYEARQRQLSSAIAEFKEFIGGQLLPVISILVSWVTSAVKAATSFAKAILGDTEESNKLLKVFERIQALIKKLQPAMERFATAIKTGINRAISVVQNIADKLGGMENLFKILATAAAAFVLVSNWEKLISGAKAFMTLLSGLSKLFGTTNLKTLLIVAAVTLLLLIVEDFINFLEGNDSVIGTIFDKAGIGADNAREAIFNAWTKIKEFLLGVWDTIKQMATMTFDTIKSFIERHADQVKSTFERVWNIISELLGGIWTFISQLATTLFGDTEDSIDGSTQSTKDKVLSVWQHILDALSSVFDAIFNAADAVFNALLTVVEFVFNLVKAFWDQWGATILDLFKTIWDNLGRILNDFLAIVTGLANFIKSVFTGDWKGAWNAIKDVFSAVWDSICAIASTVWGTIKTVFSIALSYISGLWSKIWNGISSFFSSIWEKIKAVLQVAIMFIGSLLKAAFDIITLPFQLIWQNCHETVEAVWDAIKEKVSSAINAVSSVISSVMAVIGSVISAVWTEISTNVSAAVNAIKAVITTVFNAIKSVVTPIWNAIKSVISTVVDSIKSKVSSVFSSVKSIVSTVFNSIKTTASSIWNAIKSTITTPIEAAKNTVKTALDKISSYFSGLKLSFPSIKLPHFSITGSFSLAPPSVPKLSISWYKEGGILDGAQIFGSLGGDLLGGGEAGKEAVLPLSELWTNMRSVMTDVLDAATPDGMTASDFLPEIVDSISALTKATTANLGTASTSSTSSRVSNITQNVNIDNTYTGGSSETQKNVSSAMKKSATDATTYMARGLAYAR
jgi:phage-related protein